MIFLSSSHLLKNTNIAAFDSMYVMRYGNYKKCITKEERVRHLPGYCPQTSQETKDAEER